MAINEGEQRFAMRDKNNWDKLLKDLRDLMTQVKKIEERLDAAGI
jgi:hypothetical protein